MKRTALASKWRLAAAICIIIVMEVKEKEKQKAGIPGKALPRPGDPRLLCMGLLVLNMGYVVVGQI